MVIDYLVNHNFIEAPKDFNILSDLSSNSKKTISLEVVENLTQRYLDALHSEDPNSGKNKSAGPAVMTDKFPSCGPSLWKLSSWDHVKWTIHSIEPVFSLNLDSINAVTNAVKIYCFWLRHAQYRPVGVNQDNLEEFVTSILFSLAELFEPRKGNDLKSTQFLKRHTELCQDILKVIVFDLVPNSPSLFTQKASKTWKLLAQLLLGITDNLLWSDKQNYLADDLSEILLNSLFFVFLESGIFCDEIWKKFTSSFKLWCHRLKSVLVWGSVIVALNSRIASILYNTSEVADNHEITFGMHSYTYKAHMETVYANYCWIRITNFLPNISNLSGDVFLRALQAHEKIITAWLTPANETSTDPTLPDANTLFEIYGESLFEASLVEKSSHDQGRAIAISIICKIISKWQYRESISDQNLSKACESLRSALTGDILAAATALYHIEPVLTSGHSGIFSLIIPVFSSLLRFIPKSKTIKCPLQGISLESLRMCCYRLLNLIYSFFDESDSPISFKIATDLKKFNFPFDSIESVQTIPSYSCFVHISKNPMTILKGSLLDTLLSSLLIEDSPKSIRFILNSISTVLFANYLEFPSLFPFLVKTFEDFLLKPPTNWANSIIDTQITIVRILEQWSRLATIQVNDSIRLCNSLICLMVSLYSKASLPTNFKLIISIYETIFSWLSVSGSPFVCVSSFIGALVKFTSKEGPPPPIKTPQTQPSTPKNSLSQPNSPSHYGIKTHKSLAERVFTLEFGTDDLRPSSMSPTLLKGIDEIFLEYTNSALQRLISLLLQEQINVNYPVNMNSTISDLDLLIGGNDNIKYFTIASSIIVGVTDKLLFIRNSVGKFTWCHEFKVSSDEVSASIVDSSVPIDLNPVDQSLLVPFNRQIVVTESVEVFESEIILNESNWIKTFENDKKITAKITPILNEVAEHIKTEIIPFVPLKAKINRVNHQPPMPLDTPEILSRLLFAHLGLLNSSTQALIGALNTCSQGFISDLKKLDEIPTRESIHIPIYFNSMENAGFVSKSFEAFIAGLGGYNESSNGPIYADPNLLVTFPVILSDDQSGFTESVSIVWSESVELSSSLPQSDSNFIYFLISPILINQQKGQFFKIRILLANTFQSEINSLFNSFGPILDGMIVKKSNLSQMVRESSIHAHRFISNFIENCPTPIMKRQVLLKSIIFKNYQPNSYGSLIKTLI